MKLTTQKLPFILLGLVVCYTILIFSVPYMPDIDGHWHITLSHKMWSDGIIKRLPELAYTMYNEYYREHHFLFQVLYMPFALIPDLYLGEKIAALFYASFAGIVFVLWLRRMNVQALWFWTLLYVAGSSGFLFRIMMARVQSVSLLWILLCCWCLQEKRYRLLALLSFSYVWLYDAFLLLIPILFVFMLAEYLVDKKIDKRAFISVISGLVAGIIINPYFPHNITSYYYNAVRSVITTQGVAVGVEWLPYSFEFYYIGNLAIAITLIFALAYLSEKAFRHSLTSEHKKQLIFLMGIFIIFFGLTCKSKRFIEYAPPFAIALSAYIYSFSQTNLKSHLRWYVWIALFGAFANIKSFLHIWDHKTQQDCYRDAGAWIRDNVPSQEIIYNADWDDFPPLYIQAHDVRYIVGLDPLFMATYKPELFDVWSNISKARTADELAPLIWKNFSARFIFSDTNEHKPFVDRLLREGQTEQRFLGEACSVLEIKPEVLKSWSTQ